MVLQIEQTMYQVMYYNMQILYQFFNLYKQLYQCFDWNCIYWKYVEQYSETDIFI